MERTDLLKSKEYWMERFQNLLFQKVDDYLQFNGITKTQFAEQLKVSKSYVSQVLNGDFDHKLSKFVELTLATGNVPLLDFKDLNQFILEDAAECGHPWASLPISNDQPDVSWSVIQIKPDQGKDYLKKSMEIYQKFGDNSADCQNCLPEGPLWQSAFNEENILPDITTICE